MNGLEEIPHPADCHDEPSAPALNLPEAFWNERPWLKQIRDAAWVRIASPDAVLGAFLARYAAAVPPQYQIPPIVGSHATFDHLSVIVSDSAGGKSSGTTIARELFPAINETNTIWDFPCPSGEGLIEAFFELVEREEGKKGKEKKQTRRAVHFQIDEADALVASAHRQGATIASVLCSAWAGQTLGQGNAARETRRVIQAGTGRVTGIMGIQTDLGHQLMTEKLVTQGLTGRMLFFHGTDPTVPPIDHLPGWPGTLQVDWLRDDPPQHVFEYPASVVAEVRQARWQVVTGAVTESPVEGHQRLARLKLAGLFAAIEERTQVTESDWALAGQIVTTSSKLRDVMRHRGIEQKKRASIEKGRADGLRQFNADEVIDRHHVERRAAWVRDRIKSRGDQTRKQLVQASGSSKNRQYLDQAIELAALNGWISTWPEPSRTGSESLMIGSPQ